MTTPEPVSVVIPTYREAARLPEHLPELARQLDQCSLPIVEVIFCDDGSDDATPALLTAFVDQRRHPRTTLLVLRLPAHRGKGAAVRAGMLAARAPLVAQVDADLSASLAELGKLLAAISAGADVAIGSRDMPSSTLLRPQPLLRRVLARGFRALRRRLILPRLRDTQCGLKLWRTGAAREVYGLTRVDGWLADVEALAIADGLGLRIAEVGICWRNDPRSHVHVPHALCTAPFELLKLRRRIRPLRVMPVATGNSARSVRP